MPLLYLSIEPYLLPGRQKILEFFKEMNDNDVNFQLNIHPLMNFSQIKIKKFSIFLNRKIFRRQLLLTFQQVEVEVSSKSHLFGVINSSRKFVEHAHWPDSGVINLFDK